MTKLRSMVPNILTVSRLVLSGVFIWLMCSLDYAGLRDVDNAVAAGDRVRLIAAFIFFVVAVVTDVADGHLARRWAVVSRFGRIADPLADKILIAGGFIILAYIDMGRGVTGIAWWMVAVVLAREVLISVARHVSESRGVDFSANWAGKWKMILQSIAIGAAIVGLIVMPLNLVLLILRDILIWAAVLITVLSVLWYLPRMKAIFSKGR